MTTPVSRGDGADQEVLLRSALRDGGVHAALQPVLRGRRPVAVEALARFVGPLADEDVRRVIALAETCGLVEDVSDVVLLDALDLLATRPDWHGQLAWNVAPRHLARPDFEARLAAILDARGVPFDRLLVEVTESAMTDAARCVPVLARLRACGASIAIDDFGTGSSSISRLLRLPVDVLKIDQALIAELPGVRGLEVVRSVRALAAAIGATVVAEGVERREQLDALRPLGDVLIQGFLTGAPTRDVGRALTGSATPSEHGMVLHENDAALARELADFALAGLAAREVTIMVLTADHEQSLRAELDHRGADLGDAVASGAFRVLDAEATLPDLLDGDRIDDARFERIAGAVVRAEIAAGRRVRVYGDMTSLLWSRGNLDAALALEECWNGLGTVVPVTVLCGFPDDLAGSHADLLAMQIVHSHEGHLVPTERDPRPAVVIDHRRLAELHALDLARGEPVPALDAVTRLAGTLFDVDIAFVSLVNSTHAWFASRIGLDATESPRGTAISSHTVLDDVLLVVPDTRRDPRFSDFPFVVGEPYIAFYAGAPIHAPSGARIGAMCVAQSSPRTFSDADRTRLVDLAVIVDAVIARQAVFVTDALTGLANRRGLVAALQGIGDDPPEVLLMLARLDGLRSAGLGSDEQRDRSITVAGDALRRGLHDAALVARSGGIEFGALFVGVSAEEVRDQVLDATGDRDLDGRPGVGLTAVTVRRRPAEIGTEMLARASRVLDASAA